MNVNFFTKGGFCVKLLPASLLSSLLVFALVGCTTQSIPGSVSATASALDTTIKSDDSTVIQIKLDRVKDEIKAEDGHVLVSYAYDRPTVTISGNSAAQSAIQTSLNALVDKDLTYVKEDLYTIAQGDYQALGKDATPCTSELNFTVTRSDDTVISLVADEIQDAGGAHGSDWRSGWNCDTETGQLLTFPDLGNGFREKAMELVSEQAALQADFLFDGYQENLSHVVLDGTENAQNLYGFDATIAPTFYMTDKSIVFLSREYELQPYSMGVLEFPTAYSDYGSILKEHYLPKGYVGKKSSQDSADPAASSDADDGTPEISASAKANGLTLTKAGTFQGKGWMLTIPANWDKQIYVTSTANSVTFYEKGCYDTMGGGRLFSIQSYQDNTYQQLPDYELLSIDRNTSYVVVYPTDVQFAGADQKSAQRYSAFSGQIEKVLKTFSLSS